MTDHLGVGKLEDLLKAGDTWEVTESQARSRGLRPSPPAP
jgi:hypothetical protein